MPASLLRSQLETLEHLNNDERGVEVDIDTTVDDIVGRVLSDLTAG